VAMTPASGRSRTGTAAPTPEGAKLEAAPGASRGRDGAARHRTHAGDEDRADPQKHELATATATPSPPPPPRHGFRGGQRRRACALELERSGGVAAPGTPTSPAPSSSAFHGGAGQIRRPRARPVAAAAGSGGLDVRLRRWWRPPRAPWRPDLARPPPPFLAGGHDGCPREAMAGSRSPASGAVERRRRRLLQVRWRSRSGGGRQGAGRHARGTAGC